MTRPPCMDTSRGEQAPWLQRRFTEASTAMAYVNAQGRITAANLAMETLLERPAAALVGADLLGLAQPQQGGKSTEQVGEAFRLLVGDGWPQTLEQAYFSGVGAPRWMRKVIVPELDHRGEILHALVRFDDLTPMRRDAARLRQAATAFVHAPDGMLVMDPRARIVDVNAAFLQMTGLSRDEVVGSDAREVGGAGHGPGLLSDLWEQLLTRDALTNERWSRRKTGTLIALRLCINAIRDETGAVDGYLALFSDITAHKLQVDRLQRHAHHDALTGLPNRVLLKERLEHALHGARRRDQYLAVIYLDLDDFKVINDTHGHEVGDRFLMAVARRLRGVLRDADTIARLGGDEFVVVLNDREDVWYWESIVARLQATLNDGIVVDGTRLCTSASLGVALCPPWQRADAATLLHQADQAMYAAKRAGKGQYRVSAISAADAQPPGDGPTAISG